jgi:hypothetical protein
MRTYIYTRTQKNNDRNGNPRSTITVYRVIKNVPHRLGEPDQDIGYRGDVQAACDIILDNEKGWGKRYQGKHGTRNPVQDAITRHRCHEEGKQAQIFSV